MYGISDPNYPVDMNKLTTSIQVHEGLELKIYDDANGKLIVPGYTVIGNPTIGWGRCLSTKGVTSAEANQLLGNDIADVILQAEAQAWWETIKNDDVRARAIIEILFNLGLAKLNTFVKALNALANADFSACAAEFRNSTWAKQVRKRAVALTAMIETGQDS